jgi:hypothetical protein
VKCFLTDLESDSFHRFFRGECVKCKRGWRLVKGKCHKKGERRRGRRC